MKYIIIRTQFSKGVFQEIPFIFPETLTHSLTSEALLQSLEFKDRKPEVVSAGFYNFINESAYGNSVSLKLHSRESDSELISGFDFHKGLI